MKKHELTTFIGFVQLAQRKESLSTRTLEQLRAIEAELRNTNAHLESCESTLNWASEVLQLVGIDELKTMTPEEAAGMIRGGLKASGGGVR